MGWLDSYILWCYEFVKEIGLIPSLIIVFLLFVSVIGMLWISITTDRSGNRW